VNVRDISQNIRGILLTFLGCRKGKRDCVYPELPSSKAAASQGTSKESSQSHGTSPETSPDEGEDDEEGDNRLEPILDEEETGEVHSLSSHPPTRLQRINTTSSLNLHRVKSRQSSETPSLEGNKSSSPSVSTGTATSFATSYHLSDSALQSASSAVSWSSLPTDLQYYLDFYATSVTHYNYGMVNDVDDFFRTILPAIAVQSGNEPLLYALVGFSAYHRTLQDPNGQIKEFLQYYNKSVTMLLSSLKRSEKQSIATLLTILQLATIEVSWLTPVSLNSCDGY
jgi:hypothetical protein